jgi:D-alanyl-D-alanine carboxypeptidase/D-alanyl-D-alanine-endopeptidase (penicillin-binding protein 4)
VGLAGALVAVALAGGGSGRKAPTAVSAVARTVSTTTTTRVRRRATTHVAPVLIAQRRRLEAVLAHLFVLAGPASGAALYDLSAHAQLFELRDGARRPPASVEKLYTSITLLRRLGPDARLQTTVLGAGHLGPRGVWHGDLYLHGGGDPTFGDGAFNRTWEQGYGPTAGDLAGQLIRAGIRRVTGAVIGDVSMLDDRPGGPASGYGPDIADFGGELSALTYDHGSTLGSLSPGAFAARALALTLRAEHVQAFASSRTAVAPASATELASVSSPPLSVLLRLTDVPSDDLFAELLTEQLGARFGAGGTISAGARVIADEIDSGYGLRPAIVDGSGLSRADQSTPGGVVQLLRDVWHTPVGDRLSDSLPVVGMSGTTRRIATGTAAQGRCVAKTGTLDYVTNIAGYCHSRGGHVVAFALFVDGPTNDQALMLEGSMLDAIARY